MIRSTDTLQRNFNVLQKKQENISSNVSNANTYGFKSQQIITKTDPQERMFNFLDGPDLNQRNDIGSFIFGNRIDEINKNMTSGGIKQTNSLSDFAITGNGYFNVQLPDGTVGYTKNGHFQVNQLNQLVTQEGYPVVAEDGNLIDSRGNAFNFRLTQFADVNDLTARGETIFVSQNAGIVDNQSRVDQKMLENSNVNMVDEMTNLMETAREFEINQKALHTSDETLRKVINEIGRV